LFPKSEILGILETHQELLAGKETQVLGQVREFDAHSVSMALLQTYPIWVRFLGAAEHQREKRAIFNFRKKRKNSIFTRYKSGVAQHRGKIWAHI
jgi:hypothetical protein